MGLEKLSLNGFRLALSADDLNAYVQDLPDNSEVSALREKHAADWFLNWFEGKLYAIPRHENPAELLGAPTTLQCTDHLGLIRARIADALPGVFSPRPAISYKPFTFVGLKEEIVAAVCESLNLRDPLLSEFQIRPAYELDVKVIALDDDKPELGIFIKVGTKWSITAQLSDLAASKIDLRGLFVVRRQAEKGERRLVGEIDRLDNGTIHLSEHYAGTDTVSASDVMLEGSKASFARCLKVILPGYRYEQFDRERDEQMAQLLDGPALFSMLDRMGGFLRDHSPIRLAPDLEASVGNRFDLANPEPPARKIIDQFPPVEFCYDTARTKRNQYPWLGLQNFGPFSRSWFSKRSPFILLVCPEHVQGPTEQFFRLFRDGITSVQNSKYPGGFAKVFSLAEVKHDVLKVPLAKAGGQIAQAYCKGIGDFLARVDAQPDAAIVVIQDEHANLPERNNPYLASKAMLLMHGIPVQEIKVSRVSQKPASLQYILQNIAVAMYAKLGGTPWTVDHDLPVTDEIVIGMGYCELSGSRFEERQRFVGITTVFQGDGNYLLSHLSGECPYDEYPEHLRQATRDVLSEMRKRNGWSPGDRIRIIFHIYKPLKRVEISQIVADCVDVLRPEFEVEFAFLTVKHDHSFALLDLEERGMEVRGSPRNKGVFVPKRGCMVQIGPHTTLLNTTGTRLIKRVNTPLPEPLLIHLHPESTFKSLNYLSEQVLKFTGLSWRSTLPARKPATIYYSELIAELLARCQELPDWSPAVLNSKLRSSRWFL